MAGLSLKHIYKVYQSREKVKGKDKQKKDGKRRATFLP